MLNNTAQNAPEVELFFKKFPWGACPRPTVFKHTLIGPLWGPTDIKSLDTPLGPLGYTLSCPLQAIQELSEECRGSYTLSLK